MVARFIPKMTQPIPEWRVAFARGEGFRSQSLAPMHPQFAVHRYVGRLVDRNLGKANQEIFKYTKLDGDRPANRSRQGERNHAEVVALG